MRNLIIGIAVAASVAGAAAWQAHAAVPAGTMPQAFTPNHKLARAIPPAQAFTPINKAACEAADRYCPQGKYYRWNICVPCGY